MVSISGKELTTMFITMTGEIEERASSSRRPQQQDQGSPNGAAAITAGKDSAATSFQGRTQATLLRPFKDQVRHGRPSDPSPNPREDSVAAAPYTGQTQATLPSYKDQVRRHPADPSPTPREDPLPSYKDQVRGRHQEEDQENRPAPGAVHCSPNNKRAQNRAGREHSVSDSHEEGPFYEPRRDATIEIPAAYLVEESTAKSSVFPQRSKKIAFTIIVLLLIAAVVVGGVCGSGKCGQASEQQEIIRDANLMASVRLRTSPQELLGYASAEKRLENDVYNSSTGTLSTVLCDPAPCLWDPANCKLGATYKPGCCLGTNCTDPADQCGEWCPDIAGGLPCRLKDPSNTDCFHADCYTCDQVDGEDLWVLYDQTIDIDCLAEGIAISNATGQPYKWATMCGSVSNGGKPEANYGIGEYACMSVRQGAGFSAQNGGVHAAILPCHFIQHGECGCAPADVVIFGGLDPPDKPCMDESDCRFLCEDAGREKAQNLCYAFGIDYWGGNNFLGQGLWVTDETIKGLGETEVEIYIKGVEL